MRPASRASATNFLRRVPQTAALASQERTALLAADTNILQSQIAANSQLSSQYLQAFSTLASDPNIPATTRNAYIAEFQRVMAQGQNLINVVSQTPLNWGPAPVSGPAPTTPAPSSPPLPNLPDYGSGIALPKDSVPIF
jgi:hypothetical protein